MVDRGDSFLREVEEDFRRDQLLRIWQRYGVLIVALAVLAVAAIAGYKYWQHQKDVMAQVAGQRFEAASRLAKDGKTDQALATFTELSARGPEGYRVLARLRVAGGLAKAGKSAEAVSAYDSLAQDGEADPLLCDYAALQSSMLRLDAANWTEMQNRLSPLLSGTSPWRSAAREVLALAALKAGRTDEARKALEEVLSDRKAQQTAIARAHLLLSVLTDQDAAAGTAATQQTPQPGSSGATNAAGAKGPDTAKSGEPVPPALKP